MLDPAAITRLVPATALALGLCGCVQHEDQIMRPTVRLSATVLDEFDAEVSSGGMSLEGETEYSSIDLGVGVTFFEVSEEGQERKVSRAEFALASAEFFDLDAVEFSGGGRYYFGAASQAQPFVALYSTGTYFEDVGPVEVGTQLGIRLGGGVEYAVSEHVFLDAVLDYTIPIIAAESNTLPEVETEVDGLALRLGIGFIF